MFMTVFFSVQTVKDAAYFPYTHTHAIHSHTLKLSLLTAYCAVIKAKEGGRNKRNFFLTRL